MVNDMYYNTEYNSFVFSVIHIHVHTQKESNPGRLLASQFGHKHLRVVQDCVMAALGFLSIFSLIWHAPPSLIHSGTPQGVPVETDCAMRKLAYQFGKKQAPQKVLRACVQMQRTSLRKCQLCAHVDWFMRMECGTYTCVYRWKIT